MKKCPKCRKMNFSNVSFCTDCGENLEFVQGGTDNQPYQFGMHWFWAWLIMQGISLASGFLINFILSKIFSGMSPNDLKASLSTYVCIEMVCRILLTYLSIFIWIRLTFRRYFYAGPWTFFTYLWNITTLILMLMEFNKILSQHNMQLITIWVITLLGILFGVIGFHVYKKKLKEQLL
jgi:hypothetical protein